MGSKVEVLNTAGNVVLVDLGEIKGVYFVRDFADSNSTPTKDIYDAATS